MNLEGYLAAVRWPQSVCPVHCVLCHLLSVLHFAALALGAPGMVGSIVEADREALRSDRSQHVWVRPVASALGAGGCLSL